MRSLPTTFIALVMAGMAWPAASAPGTGTDGPMIGSLPDALETCLANASEISAARRMRDALVAAVDEARSAYWPTLDVFGRSGLELNRGTRTSERSDYQTLTRAEGGLRMRAVLFDFGARDARVDGARAALEGGDATVKEAVTDILMRCASVYLDLMRQREVFTSAETNLQNHRRFLQLAQRKQAQGETGETPVVTASARFATKSREREEELGRLRQIDSTFRRMTGLPSTAPTGRLEEPSFSDPNYLRLDTLLEAAEARSPSVIRARASLAAAEQNYVAARADRAPTVSIDAEGAAGRNTSGVREQERSGSILATLNIPIFDGGLRQAKGMQAAAGLGKARSDLTTEQRKLEERIRRTLTDYDQAKKILASAAEELKLKDRLVRLYEQEVETKGRAINDLLSAADDLSQSTIVEATARYQRYVSVLALSNDIGELPDLLGVSDAASRLTSRLKQDRSIGLVWASLPPVSEAGMEPPLTVRTAP